MRSVRPTTPAISSCRPARGYQGDGALARTRREHAAIHRALAARDPEAARAAATVHVAGVEQWLRSQLDG